MILRVGKNWRVQQEFVCWKCHITRSKPPDWMDCLAVEAFTCRHVRWLCKKSAILTAGIHTLTRTITVVVRVCIHCQCVYSRTPWDWICTYSVTFETFMSCHQCAKSTRVSCKLLICQQCKRFLTHSQVHVYKTEVWQLTMMNMRGSFQTLGAVWNYSVFLAIWHNGQSKKKK